MKLIKALFWAGVYAMGTRTGAWATTYLGVLMIIFGFLEWPHWFAYICLFLGVMDIWQGQRLVLWYRDNPNPPK